MKIIIINENEDYLTLWKEQGVPITPTKSNPSSLISYLISERPELTKVTGYKANEFGLLNRIDNDTGGIILVAKHNNAFTKLKNLMKQNKIIKIYLALCYDKGIEKKCTVKLPIGHHYKNKKKMVIANEKNKHRGKAQICETQIEKIIEFQARQIWSYHLKNKIKFPENTFLINAEMNYTWILCHITRGKRHQIRLHLSTVGYPIVGDKLYLEKESLKENNVEFHQLYSVGVKFKE